MVLGFLHYRCPRASQAWVDAAEEPNCFLSAATLSPLSPSPLSHTPSAVAPPSWLPDSAPAAPEPTGMLTDSWPQPWMPDRQGRAPPGPLVQQSGSMSGGGQGSVLWPGGQQAVLQGSPGSGESAGGPSRISTQMSRVVQNNQGPVRAEMLKTILRD